VHGRDTETQSHDVNIWEIDGNNPGAGRFVSHGRNRSFGLEEEVIGPGFGLFAMVGRRVALLSL
jgi:hypothetical protein